MHHQRLIQAFAEHSQPPFLFRAEKFWSTESFLPQKSSHAFYHPCRHSLNVLQFCYILFEMVTTELHTDSSLGLTKGLYMGMMLFTVLLSVFLVTPNFWFAFQLFLSTELMFSRIYTLTFHSLVAMVSMRSSIPVRSGNFSSCALLYIYLHWLSPANLFIHYSVIQNPSTILHSLPSSSVTGLSLYYQVMLSPLSTHSSCGHL